LQKSSSSFRDGSLEDSQKVASHFLGTLYTGLSRRCELYFAVQAKLKLRISVIFMRFLSNLSLTGSAVISTRINHRCTQDFTVEGVYVGRGHARRSGDRSPPVGPRDKAPVGDLGDFVAEAKCDISIQFLMFSCTKFKI